MLSIEIILFLVSLSTSMFAAIVGLGGGMLLISIMPFFLPSHAIVPIHGVSQLASNVSRFVFSWSNIAWQYLPHFVAGSVAGILVVWALLNAISTRWIPLFIGIYILSHLWWPAFQKSVSKLENFYVIGAIQTGLGPLVGATGPLTTTLLLKHLQEKESIVTTNAVFMSFSHTAKLALFAGIGFEFSEYWRVIATMALGAIAGSYVGTLLRQRINGDNYTSLLKLVLTLLAIRMLGDPFWG